MNPLSLLLADPSACLRSLVLRDLFHRPPDDEELCELEEWLPADPLLSELLALQGPDGAWLMGVLSATRSGSGTVLSTAFALTRLGYLGLGGSHPAVKKGQNFFSPVKKRMGAGRWRIL